MADHEEDAAQLAERRGQLLRAREEEAAAAEALGSLLAQIEAQPDAFDGEDAARIRASLDRRAARVAELAREADEQEAARGERELLLGALRRSLAQRAAVLEAEDARTGVLVAHQDLLVFFARKHLALQRLLDEKTLAAAHPQAQRPVAPSRTTVTHVSQGTRVAKVR